MEKKRIKWWYLQQFVCPWEGSIPFRCSLDELYNFAPIYICDEFHGDPLADQEASVSALLLVNPTQPSMHHKWGYIKIQLYIFIWHEKSLDEYCNMPGFVYWDEAAPAHHPSIYWEELRVIQPPRTKMVLSAQLRLHIIKEVMHDNIRFFFRLMGGGLLMIETSKVYIINFNNGLTC